MLYNPIKDGIMFRMSKITIFMIMFSCFSAGFYVGYTHNEDLESPIVFIDHVYDGDTIIVNITNWPSIVGRKMPIRIRGIDTPELRGSNKELANKAKDYTAKMVSSNSVEIKNLTRDKYFRLDADVFVDGQNLANLLLEQKLAKKYDGGKKPSWKE